MITGAGVKTHVQVKVSHMYRMILRHHLCSKVWKRQVWMYVSEWGLCEYVIVHTILGGSPVILWISLGGKTKWLPLKFGYHDVMRTSPICLLLFFYLGTLFWGYAFQMWCLWKDFIGNVSVWSLTLEALYIRKSAFQCGNVAWLPCTAALPDCNHVMLIDWAMKDVSVDAKNTIGNALEVFKLKSKVRNSHFVHVLRSLKG